MRRVTLNLSEDLLQVTNRCAGFLGIPRAEYIRQALTRMNREIEARRRARRLAEVSRRVRGESMRVNAEFARIERDVDA